MSEVEIKERIKRAVFLADRQIALEIPVGTAVPGFIDAAVAADDEMAGITGINP